MAERISGRVAIERGIGLITPPVEVQEGNFVTACGWLDDRSRAGYYHADVTAEGEVRVGMFFISDQDVCTFFRRVWGHGAQNVH